MLSPRNREISGKIPVNIVQLLQVLTLFGAKQATSSAILCKKRRMVAWIDRVVHELTPQKK